MTYIAVIVLIAAIIGLAIAAAALRKQLDKMGGDTKWRVNDL